MGKDKKKHKKKSKEHKKRHKKSSKSKSSCSDDGSSEEWVECEIAPQQTKIQALPQERTLVNSTREQDEWESNPAFLACTSREQLRQGKENKNDKIEQDRYMLDKIGRTDRELNPYWKDGGSGLPEESPATVESLRQSNVTVGDQGAAWLRKALQRAKEQAQDSGRSLSEVVAERWGSLEKLESMIAAAEERDKNKKNITDSSRFSRRDHYREKRYSSEQRDRAFHERDQKPPWQKNLKKTFSRPRNSSEDSDNEKTHRYGKDCAKINERERREKTEKMCSLNKRSPNSSSEEESNECSKQKNSQENSPKKFSKPRSNSSSSSDEDRKKSKKYKTRNCRQEKKQDNFQRGFSKPADSSDDDRNSFRERSEKYRHNSNEAGRNKLKESKGGFVRPRRDSEDDYDSRSHERKSRDYKTFPSGRGGWRKKVEPQKKDHTDGSIKMSVKTGEDEKGSTFKLEEKKDCIIPESEPILTDKELNELAARLVKAELLGNQELAEELKAKLNKAREIKAKAPKDPDGGKEVVILTHTDAKGFTRPVSISGSNEPSGSRRKGKKVETHAGGKRMRYFADDDKYSIHEMFQREKLNTVEDSNEVFAKLASKGIGRDESARDMEDVFEETARVEEDEGRQKAREVHRAMEQSKRTARTLDHCQWCLESQHMLKHLIVAIGTTCYLCVPPYQSLTDHHCLIVPRAHTPCATQLDEDVWTEMQDFRKAVVQIFLSQDEDVVFFESARRLNQFPHMVLNCVPVPRETGDMAPIYFKKAIQECEMEWSNNKKLVELKGRDVRRAVPKGLPYFAVDFGMDSGYAHVIEDEQLFPLNFAQEIIGGMLDLDHSIWRKQRRQTFEEQSKKVLQLNKLWEPFDITKKK